MDMRLEVVVIPVSDVDRAKDFYVTLGWRVDADVVDDPFRLVQVTPPGSNCSVQFGAGLTTAAPGTAQSTYLVVDDVEVTRDELAGRRVVAVSPVFHCETELCVPVRGADTEAPAAAGRCTRTADLRVVRNVRRPRRQRLGLQGDHDQASRNKNFSKKKKKTKKAGGQYGSDGGVRQPRVEAWSIRVRVARATIGRVSSAR